MSLYMKGEVAFGEVIFKTLFTKSPLWSNYLKKSLKESIKECSQPTPAFIKKILFRKVPLCFPCPL